MYWASEGSMHDKIIQNACEKVTMLYFIYVMFHGNVSPKWGKVFNIWTMTTPSRVQNWELSRRETPTPRVQLSGWSTLRMCRTNGRADDLSFIWMWRKDNSPVVLSFSNVEMATNSNLSESSESEQSSLSDQNLSNRSGSRSLRVAEKERKKIEAEDPFSLALKYFSDGRIQTQEACYLASSVWFSSFSATSCTFFFTLMQTHISLSLLNRNW